MPKAKQPIGQALFAISATFAPAIGPTMGGYLTENWGWQYIFYVNIVPSAIMIGMLYFSLEAKPMKLSLLRNGDWLGIVIDRDNTASTLPRCLSMFVPSGDPPVKADRLRD